jgi:phage gpG-like protein
VLNLTIQFDGEVQFSRTFTRFTEQLRDLRDIWPGVIPDFQEFAREQFRGEGVGDTGSWPALSPPYAAWKARHFPGKPILQRTGRLVDSVTGRTRDTLIEAKPDSLEFGTRVPYAVFHQRGSGRLKRRKVFDLNERQRTRLMKTIQKRLLTAGRNSGFALS